MRVSIIITDDDGNSYHGELELAAGRKAVRKIAQHATRSNPAVAPAVNFSTPIRAFVKKHASGLSGSQKFALLVAYLSKGDRRREVRTTDVEKHWNKMKPLLGGKFNSAHPTRAKEKGWVDSPKYGVYVILPGWEGIFGA